MTYLLFKFISRVKNSLRTRWWRFRLSNSSIVVSDCCRIENLTKIQFGVNVFVGRFAWIESVIEYQGQQFDPLIEIGDEVSMSEGVHIAAVDSVRIGNYCLIASKVLITDHHHGLPESRSELMVAPKKRALVGKPVVIEDYVFLGDGVVVMPGIRIGKGAIVGANSVVTSDLPAFSISVGAPAKVIKKFDR
ncbi:acyltransferase [Bdellovibrio sp. HCB274]|uniref:acyltransferase n=1 Tax=Bdellovibrio sp. HCB274 TaxID=3394361 RepID=UPI0039B51440